MTACLYREEAIERRKARLDEKFLRGTVAREVLEKAKTEQKEKEVALVQASSLELIPAGNKQ